MICRFINCDGYVSTGTGVLGFNMFAYCDNNPVNYNDHTGTDPVPAWANNILYGTPGSSDINADLNADADAWAGFAHYKVVSAQKRQWL